MARLRAAVGGAHRLGVPVIAGDEEECARCGSAGIGDPPDCEVCRLAGDGRCCKVPRMPHHVGARNVRDNECFIASSDGRTDSIGDLAGAHGGIQIVGRDPRARNKEATLAREWPLAAPIKEVGHMRVLLGLSYVELPEPCRFVDCCE